MLIDAHVHAARLSTLKPSWHEWARQFASSTNWRSAYDDAGDPVPARLDALFEVEGIDRVLLFCEYSPRATGIQSIEDNLPLVEHNPARFWLVANINPHLHHPLASELERQLDLGAVALKLHPVHAGFSPADRELVAAYHVCRERGVPVIIHSGTSSFPGSRSRFGDPQLMFDVFEDFPDINFVLAHGGRGWWYDAAAFITLMRPNVYIEVSGLPPKKLPDYYQNFDLERLARKMIFGTDWPGVPGPKANAQAIANLDLDRDTLSKVLHQNAGRIYRLKRTLAMQPKRGTGA